MISANPPPIRLSVSAIKDYQLCPRYYYYAHVARRVAIGGDNRPLNFGVAFHEGQAAWWSRYADDDRSARLAAAIDAFLDRGRNTLSPEDKILGRVLLTAYATTWSDSGYTFHTAPLAEQRIEQPVLGPDGRPDPNMVFVAVLDVLAFDHDGRTVIAEHKTTGSKIDEDGPYWDRNRFGLQPQAYYLAATDDGRQVSYVLWDVVRSPQLVRQFATPPEKREFYKRAGKWGNVGDPKPGTFLRDETLAEYEARIEQLVLGDPAAFLKRQKFYYSADQLEDIRADIWAVGQQMLAARATGAYPRNLNSCMAYNRPCQYQPVCHSGVDIEDQNLYRIRIKPTESKHTF